jgi:oligopeptidase A
MEMDANPLLDFSGLPRFAAVRPEHIAPAIDHLLADNRALIDGLTRPETPATWAGFAQPLEDANERLGRAWGVVGHLHAVLDSPELREAYKENQPKVVQYWTALGQNLALFEKYKALRAGPEFARLTAAQAKIVDNEIRDFRLSGAELPPEQKRRYAEIQEEAAKLATGFAENALDSTNAFAVFVEERAALAGIPDDVLEAARAAAEKDGRAGWKFLLHIPSYLPVMQYAENRALREIMYRGSVTRASGEFAAAFAAKAAFEERVNGKPPAEPWRSPRCCAGPRRSAAPRSTRRDS